MATSETSGKTLTIILPENLDDDFRKKLGAELGAKRGVINKAGIQAVELWTYGEIRTK